MSEDGAPYGETNEAVDTGTTPATWIESLVLSVVHHWHLRETAARQVELIERHFCQDEMLSALRELETVVKISRV